MRIDRLHLKAYGRFDNCELDLTGPGFVVVHGSNEAGKTTALNAIGDWLFGFERSTAYDFLHKSSELRVGGTLRQLADSLVVYRRKGNRDTLRCENEKPIPDAALRPYCGTMTRAQFEGSFGLTHERLRTGGEELRENRGELAQALFSAASGLTSLRRWQEVLKSNREKLYKPSGQNPELNKALSECKAAKLAIRTDAIPIEDVRRLEERNEELKRTVKELRAEEATRTERLAVIARVERAAPFLRATTEIEAELAPLHGVRILRGDFEKDFSKLLASRGETQCHIQNAEKSIAALEKEATGLNDDPAIRADEEELDRFHGDHEIAAKNRESLTAEAQNIRSKIGECRQSLQALRMADTRFEDYRATLRLEDLDRKRIEQLIPNHAKLQGAEGRAETDFEERKSYWEELAKVSDVAHAVVDTTILAEAVRAATETGPLDATILKHECEISKERKQLENGALGLEWSKPLEEIAACVVPSPAAMVHHRKRIEDVEATILDARRREREALAELEQTANELHLLTIDRPVVHPDDLARARSQRQRGWALVRQAWLDGTIDSGEWTDYLGRPGQAADLAADYERHSRRADDVGDELRTDVTRVTQRVALDAKRQKYERILERVREELAADAATLQTRKEEWAVIWTGTPLSPKSPAERLEWRKDWDILIGRVRKYDELVADHRADREQRLLHVDELKSAIEALGDRSAIAKAEPALKDWLALAKKVLERFRTEAEVGNSRDKAQADAKKEFDKARRAFQAAQKALAGWQTEWTQAFDPLRKIGVPEFEVGEAQDGLSLIKTFVNAVGFLAGREREVLRLTGQIESWKARFRAVAERLGDAARVSDLNEPVLIAEWRARLKVARSAHEQSLRIRKELTAKRVECERYRIELGTVELKLDQIRNECGAPSLDEIPRCIVASNQRRLLDDRLQRESKQLAELAAAAGMTGDRLREETAAAVDCDLMAERRLLIAELQDLDQRREKLSYESGQVEAELKALVQKAGALASRAAAESAATRIRELVPEYASLVLAEAVLNRSIERYRERNKSGLLEKAARHFRTLTCGSFANVDVLADDKNRPYLVGIRPNKDEVAIDGMSEGTVDQLFFALKLAHLETHVVEQGPFPVILDDVLLAFDNDRAKAALECLADFGATTQVLFFTHHQHLRDMAAATLCERVKIVELNS